MLSAPWLHVTCLLSERASVTVNDLLLDNEATITRPIIEYVYPLGWSGLTIDRHGRLESIK